MYVEFLKDYTFLDGYTVKKGEIRNCISDRVTLSGEEVGLINPKIAYLGNGNEAELVKKENYRFIGIGRSKEFHEIYISIMESKN
jgi:hypothetical protein